MLVPQYSTMALLELPHCLMIAGPCWSVPALLVSSSAEGRRTKVDPPPDEPIDRRLCNSKSKNTTSHPTTRSNSRAFRGPSLRPKWTGPGLPGSRRPATSFSETVFQNHEAMRKQNRSTFSRQSKPYRSEECEIFRRRFTRGSLRRLSSSDLGLPFSSSGCESRDVF